MNVLLWNGLQTLRKQKLDADLWAEIKLILLSCVDLKLEILMNLTETINAGDIPTIVR